MDWVRGLLTLISSLKNEKFIINIVTLDGKRTTELRNGRLQRIEFTKILRLFYCYCSRFIYDLSSPNVVHCIGLAHWPTLKTAPGIMLSTSRRPRSQYTSWSAERALGRTWPRGVISWLTTSAMTGQVNITSYMSVCVTQCPHCSVHWLRGGTWHQWGCRIPRFIRY